MRSRGLLKRQIDGFLKLRELYIAANLNVGFLSFTAIQVTYIHNPRSSTQATPYELVYKRVLDLALVRVLGAQDQAQNDRLKRQGKSEKTSEEIVFLHQAPNHSGFMVKSVFSGRIHAARGISLDEEEKTSKAVFEQNP